MMEPTRRIRLAALPVAVLATAGFIAIAHLFVMVGHEHAWDTWAAAWLRAHRTPELTRWMLAVTNVHAVKTISALSAAVALLLLVRRQWPCLVALLLMVPGGMVANVWLKHVFQRARPLADGALQSLSTFSFPSGHASAATLLYGTIWLAFIVRQDPGLAWRVASGMLCLLAIAAVCVSRIYLGVHYLSDVVAGFLGAVVWLGLCVMALPAQAYRRRSPA